MIFDTFSNYLCSRMLFSRRKTAATSVEGTQGKYVKRESPPTVPSLAGKHFQRLFSDRNNSSATAVSRTRRSPLHASTLLLSSVPPPPSSTPPSEIEVFHSGNPSVEEAEIDEFEHTEDSFDLNDLREMDFDRLHSRSTARYVFERVVSWKNNKKSSCSAMLSRWSFEKNFENNSTDESKTDSQQ